MIQHVRENVPFYALGMVAVAGVAAAGFLVSAEQARKSLPPPCSDRAVSAHILKTKLPGLGPKETDLWLDLLETTATAAQISPVLWTATIWVESQFNRQVNSPAGAKGPAQIMPKIWITDNTYPECKGIDPYALEPGLACGAKILGGYIAGDTTYDKSANKCKGVSTGLRCYNAGPKGQKLAVQYAKDIQDLASNAIIKVCFADKGVVD